jgi:adenylylsulfate kinase-like enzyme
VIPVLWLCGPPGVGKTEVGWEIYTQLTQSDIGVGYVDIDQLGICYPEPPSDPDRNRLKARNLAAVVASYEAAGARCVVVSGVVDTACGVPADQIPHAALTVCRLRASPDLVRQRLVARSGQWRDVQAVLQEAAELDAGNVADVVVDTSGLSVAEVARQVRAAVGGWPVLTRSRPSPVVAEEIAQASNTADGQILWLCGATGVGKSTVGFHLYQSVLRSGLMAAYIDAAQVGFCSPAPADHRVRARSLAAMWDAYRALGAQRLVVVGPVEDDAAVGVYADALPAATITWCRLHAGRDELTTRILQRGQGGTWPEPGDALRARSTTHLIRTAEAAVADAEALERATIGLRIDTDGRTVDDVARAIEAQARLPAR